MDGWMDVYICMYTLKDIIIFQTGGGVSENVLVPILGKNFPFWSQMQNQNKLECLSFCVFFMLV